MRTNRLNSNCSAASQRTTCISTLLLAFENLLESRQVIQLQYHQHQHHQDRYQDQQQSSLSTSRSTSFITPSITRENSSRSMVIKKRKRASLSTSPPTKYLIKSLEEKLKLTSNPFAQFKSSVEALFSNYHTFPLNFQSKILDSVGYLNIIKEMNLFVDTNYSLVPSIDELTFTFSNGNGRCSTLTEILVHYQHFQDILSTNGSLFLQKGYPIDQPLFERVRMKWYSLVDHHLSSLVQRIHRDMLDTTPQVLLDQIQSTLQTLFDSQKVFGNKLAVEGEVMVNHLSDYLVSYYCSLIDSITRNDPIVMGVMDILTCHLNLFLSVARLQEDMGKSVIRVGILYLEYLSLKRQEDVFMRLLKVGVGYIGVCVRMERDDPDGMIDRFKVSMID